MSSHTIGYRGNNLDVWKSRWFRDDEKRIFVGLTDLAHIRLPHSHKAC
jgi:hypothetical protein